MAQMVKRLSMMRETWVRSLGWEDSLEEGMATHSSILAWKIPWTEEPGGLQSTGATPSKQTKKVIFCYSLLLQDFSKYLILISKKPESCWLAMSAAYKEPAPGAGP